LIKRPSNSALKSKDSRYRRTVGDDAIRLRTAASDHDS
jgi:hypothetical protein